VQSLLASTDVWPVLASLGSFGAFCGLLIGAVLSLNRGRLNKKAGRRQETTTLEMDVKRLMRYIIGDEGDAVMGPAIGLGARVAALEKGFQDQNQQLSSIQGTLDTIARNGGSH
jgi:hypothetical protein